MHEPEQLEPAHPEDDARAERDGEDRHGRERQRPHRWRPRRPGRARGRSGRGTRPRTATGRAVARPAVSCIAGRILGPAESSRGPATARPPIPPHPEADVPTRQLEARSRRPGARDAGSVAGAPRPSRGCAPRTRTAPAGASSTVRSPPTTRWASTTPGAAPTRTCTSDSTRCSARTSATRTGSTARACGSRSTSSATSASPRKRDIEAYGIDRFVTLCKQRVLTYAARQTEQSIRLGMWMDWNDPDELRRLRDLLGDDPSQVTTIQGPDGPVTDTVEMLVGRLGMPDTGGSLLHVQQREQRPDLGLPRRMPPARLAVQGPRHDAVVRPLRHRPLADGDERGLPGPRGPRPDRPLPAARPAGRVAAGLDDDALDADLERGGGGRPGTALRPRPPGRRPVLARQGHPQDRARRARSRCSRRGRRVASSSAGATPARSTTCRRCGRAFAGGTRDDPTSRTSTGSSPWDEVGEDEGTGIVHIAPGCGAEDFQLGKALGLPVIAPIDEAGIVVDGFGSLSPGATSATWPSRSSSTSSATGRFYRLETVSPTATRTAGAAGRRSSSGWSTSGSSAWVRSTTSRARR